MSRTLAWLHHAATLLVGGSGLLWAWMLYLVEPPEADEFGLTLVNHPWQPGTQALHVATAPALLFLLGALWMVHVLPRLRGGRRRGRGAGLVLIALLFPMIVSGYGLQVSVAEAWRVTWSGVHLVSSLLWLLLYLAHVIVARRTRDEEPDWEV